MPGWDGPGSDFETTELGIGNRVCARAPCQYVRATSYSADLICGLSVAWKRLLFTAGALASPPSRDPTVGDLRVCRDNQLEATNRWRLSGIR